MAAALTLRVLSHSVLVEGLDRELHAVLTTVLAPLCSMPADSFPPTEQWTLHLEPRNAFDEQAAVPFASLSSVEELSSSTLYETAGQRRFRLDLADKTVHSLRQDSLEHDVAALLDMLDIIVAFAGIVPLHGAAFIDERSRGTYSGDGRDEQDGLGTVVVVGANGAGKSTVLSAFLAAGGQFIADDRLYCCLRDDELVVAPILGVRCLGSNDDDSSRTAENSADFTDGGERYRRHDIPPTVTCQGRAVDLMILPEVTRADETYSTAQWAPLPQSKRWQHFEAIMAQGLVSPLRQCHRCQLTVLHHLAAISTVTVRLGADVKGKPAALVEHIRRQALQKEISDA